MGKNDVNQRAIVNRLAKIIGHTKSVRTMVENGRDCSEVLIQLSAVKSAINNTSKEVLKKYIKESLEMSIEEQDEERMEQLKRTLDQYMS